MKKYENDVDYQEFLIAIRKFMNDGKMFNREGELSMHPEVILEVKDKATPVKYARKGPSSMIGDEAFKGSKLGGATSVKPGAYSQAKASVSGGKKQKLQLSVGKESHKQSKIQNYFMRK